LCATKVGKGQSDLAIVNGEPPYAAFHGLGNWKGQPLKELRSLAGVTTVPTQFVTWPGAGINSSADLKGKIVMGDRLADKIFGKAIPDAVLAVNGFTRGDVKVVGWLEFSEQIKFMNMKLGDAIFLSAGMRTAPVLQLDRTTKLKFISFTPQEVEASLKRNPYLVPFTLPAGTYTQQPKAIACIGVPMVEIIRAGLPDDLVYQICKILYDKPGRFASVHPAFGKFDINFATVPRLVPYHAGAVKYFKERGVWNSQVDQWQKELLKSAGLEK
jgi:TRAP transporter TAXI family solute receptor